MKRPLAYITAAWCGSDCEDAKQAAQYCRSVYDAGFSPICPTLYHPLFLNDAIPEEHMYVAEFEKDGIEFQIVAQQMEAKELVKVVTSIIRGDANIIIT